MKLCTLLCAAATFVSAPAFAAPPKAQWGDPVKVDGTLTIDPIAEGRLRFEHVDTPTLDADAVTLRLRAGAEIKHNSGLSLLAEAEGTLALVDDYNAFPFAIADSQRRPGFAVVGDPMNVELNRLQLQYRGKAGAVTIGRQRINLDDQRWVGSAGWRQNEQTFDALRGEGRFGPVTLDATWAVSQRTIWGVEAGPRTAFAGDFGFLGVGAKLGPVQVKGFAYLLDFDPAAQVGALATLNADTQTYGLRAAASFKLSPKATLALSASFARQSDWRDNPVDFAADYIAAEAGLTLGPVSGLAGFEQLGASNGRAVQTPLATLHKFNGWADQFLTTPANGLEDFYLGGALKLPRVRALPGLNLGVTWHRFESDLGGLHYGDEWNAALGFKLGRFNLLAKYADYKADELGADTQKAWLQVEFAY
ncbi:MAG: alginate export family protein [Novosphingobium sp.]